jgi:hypothetical protein
VAERTFEPDEVERLIPELTRLLTRLRDARAQAAAARERLEAEQRRIGLSGGGVLDQAAWRRDADAMAAHARELEAGLQAIAGLGGTVKDLGLGLVDFPHERDGRIVNLCWKLGERAVRYWHGLDEGYAARKPL